MIDSHGVGKALTGFVVFGLLVGMGLGVGCWEGSKWVYRHIHIEVRK